MYLQGYQSPAITMSQPFNHKQAPSTSNLRGKMKAEQRARRIRSVDVLPEEERQNSQLVVNRRKARVNRPYWLFRPWQQSRTNIADVSHVVGSAIVEEDVPGGIIASRGEKYQSNLCCVDEGRHCYIDTYTSGTGAKRQRSTAKDPKSYHQKCTKPTPQDREEKEVTSQSVSSDRPPRIHVP